MTNQDRPDVSLTEYGSRDNVTAVANRVKSLLPGGEKLTTEQAMSVAQYAILTDANAFRGEIYPMIDSRGNFTLVDGYKLLVRWAKRQCGYSEWHRRMTTNELPEGDIGFRCYILRHDSRDLLQTLIKSGMKSEEALEIAATCAIGVVKQSDMVSRKSGRPIDPPKGWTWEQVAKKRALKNALNLSHGAPSPREIASESWRVGGIETQGSDWQDVTPEMPQAEREALAAGEAIARESAERINEMTPEEVQAYHMELSTVLHGDGSGEI